MIYQILKITRSKSARTMGYFHYVFLKSAEGKSFKTCVDESMRNFDNWLPFLNKFGGEPKQNVYLSNLIVKGKNLINADSKPREEDIDAFNRHMAVRETEGENTGTNSKV